MPDAEHIGTDSDSTLGAGERSELILTKTQSTWRAKKRACNAGSTWFRHHIRQPRPVEAAVAPILNIRC